MIGEILCFFRLHKFRELKHEEPSFKYSTHVCSRKNCNEEYIKNDTKFFPTYSLSTDRRKELFEEAQNRTKRIKMSDKDKKYRKTNKFAQGAWPPPDDRRQEGKQLFGFDEDNNTYILNWEDKPGEQGWSALTQGKGSDGETALPKFYFGEQVDHMMRRWADVPLLHKVLHRDRKYRSDTYVQT